MDDAELEGIIERNRRELEREELGANSDDENNELVESARKAREDAERTSRHPLRAYRDALKHLRNRFPVHIGALLYSMCTDVQYEYQYSRFIGLMRTS